MYEYDEETKKVDFSHNPFSMPQGELEALETKDPLDILAYQYDIVCNGVELSSGAIRNHRPDIMYKAFEIAGYSREDVDTNFSGMINAFKFGAPPHWRIGAGHRPHRHAAGRRAQHPRSGALPDEPARRGPHDERPERGQRQAAARTQHPHRGSGRLGCGEGYGKGGGSGIRLEKNRPA
jgi:hypothetical protein